MHASTQQEIRRTASVERDHLRVLQICSSGAVSGAERNTLGLSSMLRKRGHFVQAVVPNTGWLSQAFVDEEVPMQATNMRGVDGWRTVGLCIRLVRRNKVDLIHTHLTRAAYIGQAVGLATRKPLVASVHVANHDQVYRRLARGRNRIVAVSDYVRGVLHGLGVPMESIDTVYNGTDILCSAYTDPAATKAAFGIRADQDVIGVVARVCREKGSLEMVRAMRAISEANPQAHLLFVGRVVDGFEGELQAEIDRQHLRDKVTLAGVRHDIPAVIDTFSVAAMPSVLETFGIAALESMARGKPVVATRVGGLPEVVKDGYCGLLVDLDEREIAIAINYLLTNHEVRSEMGVHARQVVAEKFTMEHMVSRFETVYNRCLRA